ncbi:MAG: hypothetical protein CFE37_06915 [Alphaproteobacteria bacterium PA4]|nr:MAG: hypothetical protein CFE37_06915 [Alphaproteobacteria bacterium PA4]
MNKLYAFVASAALLSPAMAVAAPTGLQATVSSLPGRTATRTASGTSNGVNWTAESKIVATGSTGTIPAGNGNPIYWPTRPDRDSVVSLIMNYGAGGTFICTGSLLADRKSILTAGHCVSDGAGTAGPLSTTAYFYNGSNADTVLHTSNASTAIPISQIFVHPDYTGEVIDQNDIAVLRLSVEAPAFALGYNINQSGNLAGQNYTIAGVGGRSSIGGSVGVNAGTGRMREGDNRYDFTLGDAAFGGFFTNRDGNGENFFGTAEYANSIVSDFDSGLAANDASCNLGAGYFGGSAGQFCDLGRGLREAGSAGGDSGGPQFYKGKVASVTSYGLTFGTGFGDVDTALNSSFGEYNGFVPTAIHVGFITGAMVPEPGTWAMMIVGFGLAGTAMRRQRKAAVSA